MYDNLSITHKRLALDMTLINDIAQNTKNITLVSLLTL